MNDESIKILLVEDNLGDALLIREMLKEADDTHFEVIHSTVLNEALKYLLQNDFDVILLDLYLPDSIGIDSFRKMYNNAPDIPIIVLTGIIEEKYAASTIKRGAHDYLIKGEIDAKSLVQSIKDAIKI
jgi:DNA-binding NarL/FixJ family response regulator